jgi:drug/metabolite transporter (DMT)-like permease
MGRTGIGSDETDRGSPFGVMLGLAGVVMIAGVNAFIGLGKGGAGQVLILSATASSAYSVIYARRLSDVPAVTVAAGALSSAAVLLVPLCFLVESPLRCEPSARALAALAANGVAATALGFVVYFRIIRTVGGAAASSVGYLKPAFGVLLGCLLTGERLTWTIAAGLMSICLGVAAINLARFKQPRRIRDVSGSPSRTVTVA